MSENIEQPVTEAVDLNRFVVRLRPMDEAPRDGTPIIVKTVKRSGNKYRLCKWRKPYSTLTNAGAWNYVEDDESNHITERNAYGWMPEPKDTKPTPFIKQYGE